MSELLDAALNYAARGWQVFALSPRSKSPRAKTNGLLDATTDLTTIKQWWRDTPQANIGIATGPYSDLTVVDIDPIHHGDQSLIELQKINGPLPKTIIVQTGSGGWHFYFKNSGLRNSAGQIGDGIDVRGAGGYVAAPPSIHPSGNPYQFAEGYAPEQIASVKMPEWLLQLADTRKVNYNSTAKRNQIRQLFVDGAKHGTRNVKLARMAGYLLHSNLPPTFVREILKLWVETRFENGWNEECEQTVESIAKAELRRQTRGR